MYIVYLFREKRNGNVIYVGSSARPIVRLKEHKQQLEGMKKPNKIHKYMIKNNLRLYDDVSVEFVKETKNKQEMLKEEEKFYFLFSETLKNERPADIKTEFYNPRRRKVKCLNDNKIFKTVTECAKYYKKGRTTISNVLIKEKEYTWINDEKYFFEYVNE